MTRQTIIELALGLLQGNQCEPMLHDALLEYGMPNTAAHFLGDVHKESSNTTRCATARFLAGYRTDANGHDLRSEDFSIDTPQYNELVKWEAGK